MRLGRGELITETERAVLVTIARRREWIPKRALHDESEVPSSRVGETVVCAWFARARGWLR